MNTTFIVLSAHHVIAQFVGIRHFPCRFMTSLCPDRCNHAYDGAEFKVLRYESFEKPGKEGDEKQSSIVARLDSNQESSTDYQTPEISAQIRTLSRGQKVKLFYEHIYVTDGETGSKYPQRPIRSIEPI
jgi:hypothetical protein